MNDQPDLPTLLREYCWYFVMEMEAKLTLYNKILEQKQPSAIEYLSPLVKAKTPMGALGSAGAQGHQFLKDAKIRDIAGSLARLVHEFRDRETRIARREVMVRACCELFYSFELQFMSSRDKMGGHLRAMQKLAKDAVVRVLNYYVQETVTEPFSVPVITRAVTHDFKQGLKNILKQFYSDKLSNISTAGRTIEMSHLVPKSLKDKIMHIFKPPSFKSSEIYSQVGLIVVTDLHFGYYKTKGSNASKYGHRRLFGWEMGDVDGVLKGLKQDKYRGIDYVYVVRYEDIEVFSAEIYKCINEQDAAQADIRMHAVLREAKTDILKELDEVKSIWSGDVSNVLREIENLRVDNEVRDVQIIAHIKEVKDLLVGRTTKCIVFELGDPVVPFAGRENEIRDIHGAINGRMVVVCGLAGMGKTELAREYASRYKAYFDGNLLWINAETDESLTQCFHRLAEALKIEVCIDGIPKNQSIIVNEVYRKFSDVGALFIFDNVDSLSVIKRFLPKSSDGRYIKVLLTSQLQEWHQAKVVLLGVLSKAEAVKLVIDNLSEYVTAQEDDVVALVDAVQYFPLALQQAIAYIIDQAIMDHSYRISDYVAKLQSEADLLLRYEFDGCVFPEYFNNTYTKTTFATILLALGRLEAKLTEPELSISLLNAIAYMEPTIIPKELFLDWMNEESLNEAVRALRKYSLITDNEAYMYVHRLVQRILRFIAKRNRTDRTNISELLILVLTSNSLWFDNAHIASVLKHATTYTDIIFDTFKAQTSPMKVKLFLLLCNNGYYDLYKTILDDNPELIECWFVDKKTSMHLAAANNRIDFLTLLIDKGANLNLQECYKKTPLYITVEHGHLELTKLLVQRGADPKINSKSTLLEASVLANDFDVFKYIFQICHGEEYKEHDILLTAVHKSNVQIIDYLVQHGYDINVRDDNERTTLHWACMINEGPIRYLVANGVDINSKCNIGNTPLHEASLRNIHDSVSTLITFGADLTITNDSGKTALHAAVIPKASEAVHRLIDGGANIHQACTNGWTALHYAVDFEYLELIKYLLNKGAVVNCKDVEGVTPLHVTTIRSNHETIKFLLDNGADVNVKTNDGRTPLHEAAIRGYISVSKLLHSYKADFNVQDHDLRTPLHDAAICNFNTSKLLINRFVNQAYSHIPPFLPKYESDSDTHLDLIRTFLQLGADLEARSDLGHTPLHEATICGHANVALLLISLGASVNCRCDAGFTLLHEVAIRDFNELAETLVENGATCGEGDVPSPAEFAEYNGNKLLVHLLKVKK